MAEAESEGVAKRLHLTQNGYRKKLHRIDLRRAEPSAVLRLRSAIALMESGWLLADMEDRPMIIEIHDLSIRIR